jgi:hypothetical protein
MELGLRTAMPSDNTSVGGAWDERSRTFNDGRLPEYITRYITRYINVAEWCGT